MNKAKDLWETQKNWKALTEPLIQDSKIHSKIDNLLTTSYWNFRQKKGIPKGTYTPEINFKGFKKFEDFVKEERKMGHCELETTINFKETSDGKKVEGSETYEGTMSILISQKYLLNKLGMDEFISDLEEYKEDDKKGIKWNVLKIGFNELIETMAHELAHAYQNTINLKEKGEKSQCESSGDKDKQGNFLYPELVAEHTQLTTEIKQMIEASAEYQEFKSYWKEGKDEKVTSKQKSKVERDNKETNSSQSFSDKVKDKANKIGDASAQGVKKVGKKLQDSADNSNWTRWVLPIGIGLGVLLLIGIIVAIFRKKR